MTPQDLDQALTNMERQQAERHASERHALDHACKRQDYLQILLFLAALLAIGATILFALNDQTLPFIATCLFTSWAIWRLGTPRFKPPRTQPTPKITIPKDPTTYHQHPRYCHRRYRGNPVR